MKVKILGAGCPKCKTLEARVREVSQRHNIACEIEKVTDIGKIMEHGIMMTPGLVVNEKVVSVGKIPGAGDLLKWLGVD